MSHSPKSLLRLFALVLGLPLLTRGDEKPRYHEPNLCGPIAMYAVCQAHGIETTIAELSDLCGYDGFGVTVLGITSGAGKLGFKAIAYETSVRGLKRLSMPVIVDFPRGHFSVVMGWRAEGAVLFDPPRGARVVPDADLAKVWGGHVITFEKQETSKDG